MKTLQINGAGTCTTGTWVDVSDPGIVEVTKFTPVLFNSRFCTDLASKKDPVTGVDRYDKAEGSVKTLSLCVKGRLRADNSVSRHVADTSRVRAEDVRFIMNALTPCTAVSAQALPSPSTLNAACAL